MSDAMGETRLFKSQKLLLLLSIVFLPIYGMPLRFQLPLLGGKLFTYTMLLGILLCMIYIRKYKTKIDEKILIFWGLFFFEN